LFVVNSGRPQGSNPFQRSAPPGAPSYGGVAAPFPPLAPPPPPPPPPPPVLYTHYGLVLIAF